MPGNVSNIPRSPTLVTPGSTSVATPTAPTTPAAPASTPAQQSSGFAPVNGRARPSTSNSSSRLLPAAQSYKLPPGVAGVVKPADEAFNLTVLNDRFNPHKAVAGEFKKGSELFTSKTIVNTRQIIGGMLQGMGQQGQALSAILPALPEQSVMRTPAHQFNIDGKASARVVFYGGDIHHQNIDKVVQAAGERGDRVIKAMTHFVQPAAQGGTFETIMGDGVGGTTHAGGFSSGYLGGAAVSNRSDWPSDYGSLGDNNISYNAHLIGVNYQGGVRKPIPDETKLAYKTNADMWDAVLGAVVPFASDDPDGRYKSYKYNPLDAYDQKSLKAIADDIKNMDWAEFSKKHGALYCAEGQYIVNNLGPQEDTLLKKSKFGGTKIGAMIEEFGKAPGLDRKHPEKGWDHLLSKGVISQQMYDHLKKTNRLSTYLEWVPENVKGWQAYEPLEKNGLTATPMTVATLAWSQIHRYIPREGLANQISGDLTSAWKKGSPEVKKGIEALLGNQSPTSAAGKKALAELAFKASTGTILGILSKPEFKEQMFKQAGVHEIVHSEEEIRSNGGTAPTTPPKGRQAVEQMYEAFLNTVKTAANQDQLNRALAEADEKFRQLVVTRQTRTENNALMPKTVGLMLYAPPQAFVSWAQQPYFAGTGSSNVYQYIATAMHDQQRKTAPR